MYDLTPKVNIVGNAKAAAGSANGFSCSGMHDGHHLPYVDRRDVEGTVHNTGGQLWHNPHI